MNYLAISVILSYLSPNDWIREASVTSFSIEIDFASSEERKSEISERVCFDKATCE